MGLLVPTTEDCEDESTGKPSAQAAQSKAEIVIVGLALQQKKCRLGEVSCLSLWLLYKRKETEVGHLVYRFTTSEQNC